MPATGASGAVTGITLSRFDGDRIVEDRVNWDTLGLLMTLGLTPPAHGRSRFSAQLLKIGFRAPSGTQVPAGRGS